MIRKKKIIETKRVNVKRVPGEGGEETLEIGEPEDNRYTIKLKGKIIKYKKQVSQGKKVKKNMKQKSLRKKMIK